MSSRSLREYVKISVFKEEMNGVQSFRRYRKTGAINAIGIKVFFANINILFSFFADFSFTHK